MCMDYRKHLLRSLVPSLPVLLPTLHTPSISFFTRLPAAENTRHPRPTRINPRRLALQVRRYWIQLTFAVQIPSRQRKQPRTLGIPVRLERGKERRLCWGEVALYEVRDVRGRGEYLSREGRWRTSRSCVACLCAV